MKLREELASPPLTSSGKLSVLKLGAEVLN